MAHHARMEEISDSDSDPPEVDPSDLDPSEVIRRVEPRRTLDPSILDPRTIPTSSGPPQRQRISRDPSTYKRYQCLYPVYFDANRSRAEGRRVGRELALENPLAHTIAMAVRTLGLKCEFEPEKTHPKDWANPGRVKVLVKKDGVSVEARVKNKHHLYIMVATYLKQNPTTDDTPMLLVPPGMPQPDPEKPPPGPAIPRGWKMGTILPLHSPALSGGGVSENLLQDMMSQMPGGGSSSSAIEGTAQKKKKDKVKAKKAKT